MSRLDPKSREEAFSYQLEDDVKMLKVASLSGEKEFEQVLQRIEATIGAYRNKRLRNSCKKVQEKSKKSNEYMKKHYPDMYKGMKKKFPHLYKD